MDDDEDELDEDAEEDEDELSSEEDEEVEDKESKSRTTRSSKSVKRPAKKTGQKKPAKRRTIQNEENEAESDDDMPFKQQRRRGPKGRPPRTTNYQFVDARLKEIYLLSQPYVVSA